LEHFVRYIQYLLPNCWTVSLIYYSLLVRHVSGTIPVHLQGARKFIDAYSLCGNLMRSRRISARHCLSIINNNLNTVQQVVNKYCTCSIFACKMYVTFFRHIYFQRHSSPPPHRWAQPRCERVRCNSTSLCPSRGTARDVIHLLHSLNTRWPGWPSPLTLGWGPHVSRSQ
jgi:hypothetical protein